MAPQILETGFVHTARHHVAQLALAASGIVNGATADVQYTRVRNVRAIPGKPGLVTVHDERVLHVTRDRDAIAAWSSD